VPEDEKTNMGRPRPYIKSHSVRGRTTRNIILPDHDSVYRVGERANNNHAGNALCRQLSRNSIGTEPEELVRPNDLKADHLVRGHSSQERGEN
jgi:hypothetical protein